MNTIEIMETKDIEELRKETLKMKHILFLIGETLVRESKLEISTSNAVKRIRKIMTDNQ